MTDIGKEYAQALFMLACEEGNAEEVAEGLTLVREALTEEPRYAELLSSPSISLGERLAAVKAAFGTAVTPRVLSFVQLLCEKGRMGCFFEAADAYAELLDFARHVSSVVVTSAVELTAEEKQKLIQKLESLCNGRVNAEYVVDASLIGGLVVEIDGKVFDGSLRHRLRKVKDVMAQ
jgi:F-type H+-transporting ATPase subunit delta